MFWHVFKYRLKCLLRDRITLFWTLIFPLVLGTLFHFTFGHLTSDAEGFEAIKTASSMTSPIEGIPRFKRFCKPWRNQVATNSWI